MKIKLQTGDLKMGEQIAQLPGQVKPYVGQGNISLKDLNNAPHGVPAGGGFAVDASYDARPINCIDFTGYCVGDMALVGSGINILVNQLIERCNPVFPGALDEESTTVPPGYVFILRKIWNINLDPYPCYGNITIQANKSAVKGGFIDVTGGDVIDTFIVFDEGQRVSFYVYLLLSYAYTARGGFRIETAVVPQLRFYGQFLEKGGAPAQFSYANRQAGTKYVSVAGEF